MMSDPSWDVDGGWKEKAALELHMVINEKQALVALAHEQYRALKAKYQNRIEYLHVMTLARQNPCRRYPRSSQSSHRGYGRGVSDLHRFYVLRGGGGLHGAMTVKRDARSPGTSPAYAQCESRIFSRRRCHA